MLRLLRLAILASLPLLSACGGTLNHPMDCNRVLQLRIGQTQTEVRALIGEPEVAAEEGTIWSGGAPRTDYFFGYSSRRPHVYGTRDEMWVTFLKGRVVEASAYRMYDGLEKKDLGSAILLGPRMSGHADDRDHVFRQIGRIFPQVFHCAPDFVLERAVRESGYWTLDEN